MEITSVSIRGMHRAVSPQQAYAMQWNVLRFLTLIQEKGSLVLQALTDPE